MNRYLKSCLWWLLWQKRYFDTGFGVLGYLKYLIVGMGFTGNTALTIKFGIIYALVCYIFGTIWVKKKVVDMENEISNILNPFQREVRQSLNIRKSSLNRV